MENIKPMEVKNPIESSIEKTPQEKRKELFAKPRTQADWKNLINGMAGRKVIAGVQSNNEDKLLTFKDLNRALLVTTNFFTAEDLRERSNVLQIIQSIIDDKN
ncbi:MAG: hypothetical protein ABH881_02830 [bacterium]